MIIEAFEWLLWKTGVFYVKTYDGHSVDKYVRRPFWPGGEDTIIFLYRSTGTWVLIR